MKDVTSKIRKYLEARGWEKSMPGDMAKSISIEAAELLEHFQWGNPTAEDIKKDEEKLAEIKKELADVLIYCINFSILLNIDTEKVILEKIRHNEKKFPVSKVKNNSKNYFKIKKEYRKKGF
jgi:dCTP diphosphatase